MRRPHLLSLLGKKGKEIRRKKKERKQIRVLLLRNAWDHMQEFTNTRVSVLCLEVYMYRKAAMKCR